MGSCSGSATRHRLLPGKNVYISSPAAAGGGAHFWLPKFRNPMCLAIPGRIKSIEAAKEGHMRTGRVEMGGIVKDINLQLVPEAQENDYVLVHVGVAISVVDEEEAARALEFLQQMNELDELYNSPEEGAKPTGETVRQADAIINRMLS